MNPPVMKELAEARKTRAIETLSTRFSQNGLSLEEYERLAEYIHKTESERELAIVEKIVAEYSGDEDLNFAGDEPEEEAFFRTNFSILSSRTSSGPRRSGEMFVSILGSGHINIRKKDLRHGRTRLEILSILGDNVVFVEPGIRVKNRALPIMGDARVDGRVEKQARPGDPELVIAGAALLGNITVKILKE